MVRYNYLEKIKTENDVNFYDLTKLNWNDFQFKRSYQTHTLDQFDVDKFYIVVEKYYNDIFYEDMLYFINKISDPTELEVGKEIYIPSFLDIREFITSQLKVKY